MNSTPGPDLLIYTAWSLDPRSGTGVAVALDALRTELERRAYAHAFLAETYAFGSFGSFVFKRALANFLLPWRLPQKPRVLLGVDFDGYRAAGRGTAYVLNLRSDFSRIKYEEHGWMRWLCAVEEYLQKRACLRADLIIVASWHTGEAVRRNYRIAATTPVRVIPNGLADEWRSDPTPPAREPVILSVASLYPRKGLRHLLRALAIVKAAGHTFRHVHVGDGVLLHELKAEAERLGLANLVEWVGGCSDRERMRAYYRACRVFCHPCLHEDFGNVFLEAMGTGRPIVAFDNTGGRELVEHELDGLLVRDRDEAGLAAALIRLLQDYDLCVRLGQAGRAKAERYTWQATARDFILAIEELRGKKS